MESRGRSFLQEIRDAIASCSRLLLLVTPSAIKSEYVAAEWQFAMQTCTADTSLLVSGDFGDIQEQISQSHVIVFAAHDRTPTCMAI